ncbi:MAG: molybdopterin-dependent oxidoreductase [Acidobacteriota bacterium]
MVGEKAPAPAALDLDGWRLRVDGRVKTPLELTWADFCRRPQRDRTADIHCVTGWSRLATTFTGVPLVELLAEAAPLEDAAFVRFEAYSERGHDTSLPLALALEDTWLVHSVDGAPLEPRHGYPLRTVTPSRYFFKSLKWLARIELLAEDRLGYWERESSYHNVADPWPGDQRFTSGSIDPEQAVRFRTAESLKRWRSSRRVMLGLDLRGWSPADRDLSQLQLKNCDLRGARLQGVDLKGANLSLSDFRGADLRGADARGADLEGADFTGADLRGADFRDTALSATRFTDGTGDGANVAGLRLEDSTGLLGSQESYVKPRL